MADRERDIVPGHKDRIREGALARVCCFFFTQWNLNVYVRPQQTLGCVMVCRFGEQQGIGGWH